MLTDEMSKTIKSLKKLNMVESAAHDAEKKAKNDKDYSSLVSDFTTSMLKVSATRDKLDYNLSLDALQCLQECLNALESVIESSVVDEAELANAKNIINRKLNPTLSKEWKEFHSKKTGGVMAKITSIGGLVPDQSQITSIKTKINEGQEWSLLHLGGPTSKTRLDSLCDGINQANKLEQGLKLSPEVSNFVSLVSAGKARVTDVTPDILKWIVQEKMTDKFVIGFRKTNC